MTVYIKGIPIRVWKEHFWKAQIEDKDRKYSYKIFQARNYYVLIDKVRDFLHGKGEL